LMAASQKSKHPRCKGCGTARPLEVFYDTPGGDIYLCSNCISELLYRMLDGYYDDVGEVYEEWIYDKKV